MPRRITLKVSGEVYEQLEEIKEEGDYESVAFVARKAIIEWLQARELKNCSPAVYMNKRQRRAIIKTED
jgi:Arc/MetJ-type ribon-helix-helix transcriptional regulator